MKELSKFSLKAIEVMRHLLEHDVVEETTIDALRVMELEYYSLLDKIAVLEERVNIDEKTNLLKYKDDYITMIVKTASRVLDRPTLNDDFKISYIRFDIDNFSHLNNKYGHDKGDIVLIDVAKILRTASRPTDYPIRFGGEEFDVLLPATDLAGAGVYLDRIYGAMRQLKYDFNGDTIRPTISGGVSMMKIPSMSLKEISDSTMKEKYLTLQREVDDALYDAKLAGKDRFCTYDPTKDYHSIRTKYDARGKRK
ncbi:MAG: GGDEF domain-containing protein [Spirochaetota bacterium]